MTIQPGISEVRILLTKSLVEAHSACQKATDELRGLHRHYKVKWSFADLYRIQQRIVNDITALWAASDEDVMEAYKHHVGVRVLD